MATVYTHIVVGVGIAQIYMPPRYKWLYYCLAGLLPVLPDFDVFSSATWGTPLGHRGFTHSLAFALWVGFLAASLTFRLFQSNLWALTGVLFLVMASHGLLDALTRGGTDIPFFWPISQERYGNWGLIPLSDIAFDFPNPWRSRALRSEMLWLWVPTAVCTIAVSICRLWRMTSKKNTQRLTAAQPGKLSHN